jgi:hypothetical protein
MNKNRRIIWSNNEYDEWYHSIINDMYEGESEDDFDEERYAEDCSIWLDDERSNLNIPIDGCIVCFAVLDLWDGKHNGAKIVGNNVKDILQDCCGDYVTWFCDRFNVLCEDTHHDGTNIYLYRIAKDRETANKLVEKVAYNGMTEENFRKKTRSVRPFIAKVYGW